MAGARGGAGGRGAGKAVPRKLVVDVREFMSGLPSVLHQQGFYLSPVTLEVSEGVTLLCSGGRGGGGEKKSGRDGNRCVYWC